MEVWLPGMPSRRQPHAPGTAGALGPAPVLPRTSCHQLPSTPENCGGVCEDRAIAVQRALRVVRRPFLLRSLH